MAHVAESTHFYRRDGSPCYTVKAKDGSDRPATLRDARKLNLVPSVTSIIKCAAAPGLELWKANQLMMAALTLPRLPDEPESDWLKRVAQDSKEHARKAAERGTAIHAAIQGIYEGQHPGPGELWHHCMGADEAVSTWLRCLAGGKTPEVEAEKAFAHSLGFGGKVDLHGEPPFVLDFKTKEFGEGDNLKTWDEHAQQLAAYRVGLEMPSARCAICYVSVTNPGLAKLIEIPEDELQRGWDMFKALLAFWMAKTGYVSEFAEEKVAA